VWNLATELLVARAAGPHLRLRYEDFVARPAEALARAAALAGVPEGRLPLTEPGALELGPSHSPSGNPARFQLGRVPLVLDDEWRTAMGALERGVVGALTWPLLRRYGYPLRGGRP
jgi:hypothetical protein